MPSPTLTLVQAAQTGDVAAIQAHLAAGAALEDPTGQKTALHHAAMKGHLAVVRLLLGAGADPDALDRDQQTPLMLAIQKKHPAVARALLDAGADPILENRYGATALFSASFTGQRDVCAALLDAGARITDGVANLPPLHAAAHSGQVEVLTLLLERGADIHSRNSRKETALHIAVRRRKIKAVLCLLEHGASPDRPSADGTTPRTEALESTATIRRRIAAVPPTTP